MEALGLADIVDHVVLKELVYIVCRYFSKLHAIDTFKGGPWLEAVLFCELLALLFDDFFVLRDRLQKLEDLVTSCLCQHLDEFNL